ARRPERQGLLRDPFLGRRPCLAVHLDPVDAGGLAVAGRRLRRPCAAQPARHAVDVRPGSGQRVRHSLCLSRVRHRVGGASRAADVGHAPGRRRSHPADRAGGGVRPVRRAATGRRRAALARGAALVGAAVRRGRADRRLHQRQQRANSRALPRLHRRRHTGADGCGLQAAASARLRHAARAPGHRPTLAVRRRPVHAHRRIGVVGRLWRAAQGGRRRAGPAQHGRDRRHGPDGPGRRHRHRRRAAVRGGGAARHAPRRTADRHLASGPLMKQVQALLQWLFLRVEALFNRAFGDRLNPFYHVGAIAFFLFWVVGGTGLYLYAFFETGVAEAYSSVEALTQGQWFAGGILRSMHRYASDAMVVTMLIHLLRHFAFDRYHGYRWFAWITGVALIWLVYISGINGYMLPWDRLAQFVIVTSFEWLDWLPS